METWEESWGWLLDEASRWARWGLTRRWGPGEGEVPVGGRREGWRGGTGVPDPSPRSATPCRAPWEGESSRRVATG